MADDIDPKLQKPDDKCCCGASRSAHGQAPRRESARTPSKDERRCPFFRFATGPGLPTLGELPPARLYQKQKAPQRDRSAEKAARFAAENRDRDDRDRKQSDRGRPAATPEPAPAEKAAADERAKENAARTVRARRVEAERTRNLAARRAAEAAKGEPK